MMNGNEAVAFIHSFYGKGRKNGLSNMRAMLELLGNPQDRLFAVHVAGTNGKGSVCAMLESILRVSGYKTGLYTSPYLERYNERIRINGAPITDECLAQLVERTRPVVLALRERGIYVTEFEYGTALAYLAFAEQCEVCIVETGLGGRIDPTNVLTPRVSVITPIGFDHMHVLGSTLEEIASEKAGIIKPGVPVILSGMDQRAQTVLIQDAKAKGSPCTALDEACVTLRRSAKDLQEFDYAHKGRRLENLMLPLAGTHQLHNAAAVLAATAQLEGMLNIPERAVRRGLKNVVWHGRLEWVNGVLLDGAHNPHGARALASYMGTWLKREDTVLLVAAMGDKDASGVLRVLMPYCAAAVTTQVDNPRAMTAASLAALIGEKATAAKGDLRAALAQARTLAGAGGIVVCAGSLYLVGAVRAILKEDGHGV